MQTVTCFNADALPPEEVSAIVADYLALERLRVFRRLLVTRFGILTAIVVAVSWVWLSTVDTYIAAAMCLVSPLFVLMMEVAREQQLTQRIERLPDQRTEVLRDACGN